MFYARCALSACQERRMGYKVEWNHYIPMLRDPIPVMEDYAQLCYRGEWDIKPMFPVGQIDISPWLFGDIHY